MADVKEIKLSKGLDVVTLPDGEKLSVGKKIDYRTTNGKKSKGEVTQFRYADKTGEDKSSVWMRIKDSKGGETDWISLAVHFDYKEQGFFK